VKFDGVRDAARQYLDLGFRPIPLHGLTDGACACGSPECKPRDWGKHEPLETDGLWKDGTEFAPEDFHETNNIALALGPWGGSDDWLVALDWDGKGYPAMLGHMALLVLPETLTQETPRGAHLIYTVPAYAPLGNWVDVWQTKAQGYQMDLRYARGRIVVPPSKNYAGAYEWRWMREPAPLPERLIEQILARRHERGLPVLPRWDRGSKRP
jgi:hypothetical protein